MKFVYSSACKCLCRVSDSSQLNARISENLYKNIWQKTGYFQIFLTFMSNFSPLSQKVQI